MVFLRLILRSLCFIALLGRGMELRAQETAEPQVLFSYNRQEAELATESSNSSVAMTPTAVNRPVADAPPAPLSKPLVHHDPAVLQAASIEEPVARPRVKDSRKLAPLSRQEILLDKQDSTPRLGLPFEIPYIDSLGTAGTGLVLVVGLFLLCMSLMRRGGPSPTAPLPRDAVAVLGRVPLTPKQFAHLLQVGNKLVLVSITGERTDTITEVTEPAEVDRLLTLCMKGSKGSSSAEFQRMLSQMAKEPARGFLGRESSGASLRTARG